jgi:hypothetical protein
MDQLQAGETRRISSLMVHGLITLSTAAFPVISELALKAVSGDDVKDKTADECKRDWLLQQLEELRYTFLTYRFIHSKLLGELTCS